ncbi:hypothetical protein KP509_30G044300 [Ceratopteris richardii]|uniref:Amine oxidase domain-containing protein n=1 Tax=Ceratopteris richardii TaxID=49495 RepID=A0A8T2R242_CERRI|nr:hypothetical protein KP509_30G044300 [Ceratopteris richardii]
MVIRKPIVIIIGAGMAGLTAARQLLQAGDFFDIMMLEGSNKIGGRILTSEIAGDRVELGATWIHGMEGSPLYKIAQDIGATNHTVPFERQDGFPGKPVVKAEGGLMVPSSIVSPVMALYKKLLKYVRTQETPPTVPLSIGAFIAQGLDAFLSEQDSTCRSDDNGCEWLSSHAEIFACPEFTSHWTMRSLQEALFAMNEHAERVDTSANTLYDLDLRAEKEYKDYPGEHVTIPGGYVTIINEIASCIPQQLIHFGKKVEKIEWYRPLSYCTHPVTIHCSDGSLYEADHVIITMSLGVLKAGVLSESAFPWDNLEGRHVCRSVDELISKPLNAAPLFDPALPTRKIEAISRLGYGLVNKVFLQLNTDALTPYQLQQLNSHIQLVYNGDQQLKEGGVPWWMRKTFSLSPIYHGSSVLLCWFAGREALEVESLSDEEVMSGVAQTLGSFGIAFERSSSSKRSTHKIRDCESTSGSDSEDSVLRGGSTSCSSSNSSDDWEESFDEDVGGMQNGRRDVDYRRLFSGILRSKWGRNPLFHGSYSFVATGATGEDIEELAAPVPAPPRSGDGFKCESGGMSPSYGHPSSSMTGGGVDGDRPCAPGQTRKDARSVASGNVASCGAEGENAPLQLLFAGEATIRTLYSTTHGAHLSGLREAQRLLAHYSLIM